MSRRRGEENRGSLQHDSRLAMWPGITRGFDANCDGCTWAMKDGVYQVKLRSQFCPNHGGQLESVLARWARAGHNISAAAIQA